MRRERSAGAFAPGRVNLIGEHTDYNEGFALPFAIAEGVTVRALAHETGGAPRMLARARDLDEVDEFPLAEPPRAQGWRAYVHGIVSELSRAGYELVSADVDISGDVPLGGGLSSSAALEVALALALVSLCGDGASALPAELDRMQIARLCSRVENEWSGAQTGLLDQLASLFGAPCSALRIDFRTLEIEEVPLRLGGWRLAVIDSGERHAHASSGYNERRAECRRACELLGVSSLRDARADGVEGLPEPLRARARHVLGENERVLAAVAALRAGEVRALAELLNASHASLRDLYEVSTVRVDATVSELLENGAAGARMIGGGFGGAVLGLFPADVPLPAGAREVRAGAGARML
ncbi:MAG TPA: galactokinase family protein [Solirubrobacteraceae bacterium]|nr:galactokinase family protein [Solirubrobacteraceae bacterium]